MSEFVYDSHLELGAKVTWKEELWTLRNYLRAHDRAVISRFFANDNMQTASVPLSELEEENPPDGR
jgi:hypothetical protein